MKSVKQKPISFFISVVLLLVTMCLTVLIFLSEVNITKANQSDDNLFPQQYKIITPSIPGYLEFAGEPVPVYNFEVRERIEREFIVNTYFHSSTMIAIKRANRWFPVIGPILEKNNIPDDFKYLCAAESNFENVISPVGATGFWQFIEEAGKKYNLEINDQIDERYHIEKSTQAACDYLNEAYEKFGSWTMVAASYNMGIDGIENQIERQKSNNYYNLMLSIETSRYIPRIIAIKYILQNKEAYGFEIGDDEMYEPLKFYEITLDSSVTSFADYAISLGLNYKTLKIYNPWLRDNNLINRTGNRYNIKIPAPGSIELIEEVINDLK